MSESKCIAGAFELKFDTLKVSAIDCELHPGHWDKIAIVAADGTVRFKKVYIPTSITGTVRMDPEVDWETLAEYEGVVKVLDHATGNVYAVADATVTGGFRKNMNEGTAPIEITGGKCKRIPKRA